MGIYFRDILLIRISRGANNCGQHSLEKSIYFTMRFSPHFQLFYFNDRLEFCEFFEWKIKRINNADLFSQPPLLIFIKGANISGGHCIYINMLHCYTFLLNILIPNSPNSIIQGQIRLFGVTLTKKKMTFNNSFEHCIIFFKGYGEIMNRHELFIRQIMTRFIKSLKIYIPVKQCREKK